LQRAGAAFAYALERRPGILSAAGKAAPLYDAIGARDLATARRIASAMPKQFTAGEEYEEDYFSIAILAALALEEASAIQLQALLTPFGELAAGSEDPRFDVCKALSFRDAKGFGAAMDRLLQTREQEYGQAIEFEEVVEDEWATEGQFFVEGLAMVRTAKILAMDIDQDYLFIPSLALEALATDVRPLSWQEPFNSLAGE
jgi:hypothetical protein